MLVAATPLSLEQKTVFKWLNIKNNPSERANASFNYMKLIRTGIKCSSITSFLKHSQLSQKQLSKIIHLSERTLQRNPPEKLLELGASEKLIELCRLFHKGITVFNNKEKLLLWINRPNLPLNNQTPLELMETSLGMDMVHDELIKIEQGVFS
jgi:putative toxin-antitoxin system antitoxin component (TIGR02293 family)